MHRMINLSIYLFIYFASFYFIALASLSYQRGRGGGDFNTKAEDIKKNKTLHFIGKDEYCVSKCAIFV